MLLDFYSDLSVSSITVIVKKKEDLSFCFNCPSRNFDGFIFVMGGSGLFENEDLSEVLTKNSLVLLQKGDKYSVRALDDDFEYIATGYTVEPYGALKSIGLPTVQNLPKTSNVISLIGNMLNVWESRVPLFDLRTKIILEQMLVELFDMHQKTALFSQQNVLAPALEYISRHYDESISAKELADLFNTDKFSDILVEEIKMQMQEQMANDENISYWINNSGIGEEFATVSADHNFYWNENGDLVIIFDKYEVAPGSMGTPEFVIDKGVIRDVLKSEFKDVIS